MTPLTTSHVRELLTAREAPCVSLYQPTSRQHGGNDVDRARFRHLVREAEAGLPAKFHIRDVRPIVEKLRSLAEDGSFWGRTLDGLTVLASPDRFDVFVLPRPVKERLVMGGRFHLAPLLRAVQSADRFQVLCLTRIRAWMLEGNRYFLDALALGDFPATLEEALGSDITEPEYAVASTNAGVGGPTLYFGRGSRADDIALDTERFFRVIDREVLARFSKPSGLPLVLAALPEHQPIFRGLSQNPHLLPEGIAGNPEAWSREELRGKLWEVLAPVYLERLARLTDAFHTARAREAGSADLAEVACQTVAGRVRTLLLEADRVVPGVIDRETGEIWPESPALAGNTGDMLDDLVEMVLLRGGEVVVVPQERMPSSTGLAAVYRY